MPAQFLWFLFDWRGRIGRGPYRIAVLVLSLLVASLELAPQSLHGLLVGVLGLQLVVQAALDAKRLHDIGFSATWIAISSLGCIAGAAALAAQSPDVLALLAQHAREILGPAADKSGPFTIVLTGLEAAAILRMSLLWTPKSNAAGDAYALAPAKDRRAGFDAPEIFGGRRRRADRARVGGTQGARAGPGRRPRRPFARRGAQELRRAQVRLRV